MIILIDMSRLAPLLDLICPLGAISSYSQSFKCLFAIPVLQYCIRCYIRTSNCIDNNSCVDEAELLELLRTVYYAGDHGVGISQNVTRSRWINEWDISHSIFFISTTLTTIGSSLKLQLFCDCVDRTHKRS